MYPGISSDAERRLLGLLDPAVTDLVADSLTDCAFAIFTGCAPGLDDFGSAVMEISVRTKLPFFARPEA